MRRLASGRNRNRRRRARWGVRARELRRPVALGAAIVAGMLSLAWLYPLVREAVRTHPYFTLSEIVIHQRGRTSAGAVRRVAGLREGMSIWDVDVSQVRARLERLPWIRSARVRRDLPRRVTIRVREYRPAAILHVDDAPHPLHYVAATGHVFAPVGARDGRDLPYVTGVEQADLERGVGRAIETAMRLVRIAARHADTIGVVSEIHVDREDGLTLLPVRPAIPIELGWGDYDAKLARVAEVLPHWTGEQGNIRSVNGVADDQVIIRVRTIPRAWGA